METVMQLAGFYVVWRFGTRNLFASVINGPSTLTSAWLRGMWISSTPLTDVSELECSVNTFHDQICLKPNHCWDLQQAKCCFCNTEPSQIAGVNLQLRLEAERKKNQVQDPNLCWMLLSTYICGYLNSRLLVLLRQPGLMQTQKFPKGGISRQNGWDWISATRTQLQRVFCPLLKALAIRQPQNLWICSPTPNLLLKLPEVFS